MSPLDRQNDNLLEAQRQAVVDGGDLNGGHSPQPDVQAWHQSGSADDLSRSLLQVQQQEAWLQSQSRTALLDQVGVPATPLHGWAAAQNGASSGIASERLLLVVDTSTAGWQQWLDAQGSQSPGTDLVFLQPGASGVQQIADALDRSEYAQVRLLAAQREGGSLQLGSDLIAYEALNSVLPLEAGQGFAVFAPEVERVSGPSTAIATTVLGDAPELLELARESLQQAKSSGLLAEAIQAAFDESNQAAVGQMVHAFLAAEQQPQIQWARFDSSSVRGAYLGDINTILLSEALRNAPAQQLQAVLIEELGHWLEESSQLNDVDSAGDEGEVFAALLLGTLTAEAARAVGSTDDAATLLINGREQRVELSQLQDPATSLPGRTNSEVRNTGAFAAILSDGSVFTWGNAAKGGDSSAVSDQLSSGVMEVFSTGSAFAALKSDGSVVTWGSATVGGSPSVYNNTTDNGSVASQLTDGVVSIASTPFAFAALKSDGSVVTWGQAFAGADSGGSIANKISSGVVALYSTNTAFAALKSNGEVVVWPSQGQGGDFSYDALNGSGKKFVTSKVSSGVVSLASNGGAFAALKNDGSVATWGSNSSGGDSEAVASLLTGGVVEIVGNNLGFAARKDDGQVVTWGNYTQLGVAGIAVGTGATKIFTTNAAFAALNASGSVVTWGMGSEGGNSSAVAQQLSSAVVSISATDNAFAAIKSNGAVITWGDAINGGDSSSVAASLGSGVTQVVGNAGAFAAIKSNGEVITWGDALHGGNGRSQNQALASGVVRIVAGDRAFLAFKSDGSLVVWGDAANGGSLTTQQQNALSAGVVSVSDIYNTSAPFLGPIYSSDTTLPVLSTGAGGDFANYRAVTNNEGNQVILRFSEPLIERQLAISQFKLRTSSGALRTDLSIVAAETVGREVILSLDQVMTPAQISDITVNYDPSPTLDERISDLSGNTAAAVGLNNLFSMVGYGPDGPPLGASSLEVLGNGSVIRLNFDQALDAALITSGGASYLRWAFQIKVNGATLSSQAIDAVVPTSQDNYGNARSVDLVLANGQAIASRARVEAAYYEGQFSHTTDNTNFDLRNRYLADIPSFTVSYTPPNEAPQPLADFADAIEDIVLQVDAANGLLSNDNDTDNPNTDLRVTGIFDPSSSNSLFNIAIDNQATIESPYGSLIVWSDGSYTFSPTGLASQALATGELATATFAAIISDGITSASPVNFSIRIRGTNDAPIATADAAALQEDATLTRDAANGVLSNDSDPDNSDMLRVIGLKLNAEAAETIAVGPAAPAVFANEFGQLTLHADGGYSFTADGQASQALGAGTVATTSFTVLISDGIAQSSSELSFAITGANDAPQVSGAVNLGSMQEDGSFTITPEMILVNATDIDEGDTLSVVELTIASGLGTLTANGNRSWRYTPPSDWSGSAVFQYFISDGSVQTGAKRSDLLIRGDSLYIKVEGDTWTLAQENSRKVGGDLVTINSAEENEWLFARNLLGWIGLSDYQSEGQWRWSSGQPVTFLNWDNDNPSNNWGAEHYTYIDGWAGTWNDIPNDYWRYGNPFPASPAFGGVAEVPILFRGDSAYVIVQGPTWEIAQANSMALGGNLVSINTAVENEWLQQAFGNSSLSTSQNTTSGDNIYWTGLTKASGSWSWADNTPASFFNWGPLEPYEDNGFNDRGVIALEAIPGAESWYWGSVAGAWNNTTNFIEGVSGRRGIAEIKLSNALAASLIIDPVNDAPRLAPDIVAGVEDQVLVRTANQGLFANDVDPEGSSLQLISIADESTGQLALLTNDVFTLVNSYGSLAVQVNGAYSFLPNGPNSQRLAQGQNAQTVFRYTVSDGDLSADASLTFTIYGVNDPPSLQPDQRDVVAGNIVGSGVANSLLANDTDIDAETQLQVVAIRQGSNGLQQVVPSSGTTEISSSYGTLSIAADGSYSFSADGLASIALGEGQTAEAAFTVSVSDGIDSGESTLVFTIQGRNDAPIVISPLPPLPDGLEGVPYFIQDSDLLAGVIDPDQDDLLSIRNLTSNIGLISSVSAGLWMLTLPSTNQVALPNGTEDVPFMLNVQQLLGGSASALNLLISYEVIDSQQGVLPLSRQAALQRAVNLGGASVSELSLLDGHGNATQQSDGSWVISPAANRNGLINLTYTVEVGGNSIPYSASLMLVPVNDPPVRSAGQLASLELPEDSPITSLGLTDLSYSPGGGGDESAQALTYRVIAVPDTSLGMVLLADGISIVANQSLSLEELRTVQFSPAVDAHGTGSFIFEVTDAAGASITETVAITLNPLNDPAVIGGTINLQVVEDLGIEQVNGVSVLQRGGQFTITDVDGSAEALFETAVTPVNSPLGVLQLAADGNYTYSVDNSLDTVQALRGGEQHVDTFVIRSLDGTSQQVSFTIVGTADNTQARLIDGYIAAAKVYADLNSDGQLSWIDANNNQQWDLGEGEAWVYTDNQGALDFDFGSPSSLLRSIGGTDTSTGLAFTGSLSAPAGSSVITPLTTLILSVADQLQGGTPAARLYAAENSVRAALGIQIGQPLNQFDPIAALANPQLSPADRAQALAVQQQAAQIANLISVAQATPQGASALIGALTTAVLSAGNSPINLAAPSTLATLLSAGAQAPADPVVVANLAAANTLISEASSLQSVVNAQQMAQGDLAASLAALNANNGAGWLGVQSAAITENASALSVVAQLSYAVGLSQLPAPSSYRLTSADPNAGALPFSIDADGTVRVSAQATPPQLDFEQRQQPYALIVEALDANNGVIATTSLVVSLADRNEAPLSQADALAIDLAQNQQVVRSAQQGLLSNDSDPDADDALRVDISAGATLIDNFGTLVIAADGSYSFSADGPASRALAPGAIAQTSFSYTAIDALGLTSSSVLNITLTGRNDPPVDAGITPTLAPGQVGVPYVLSAASLLQGVSDLDAGDTLQIRDLQITGGTAVDNGNGTWTISSGPGSVIDLGRGPEDTTRTFGVLDLLGGSLTSQRLDVSYRVVDAAGEALNVSRGLDLARPNALSSVAISGVQLSQGQGTVTDNGNGTWGLAPDPDFTGTLAITYQLSTGGQPSTTTATFGVLAVNDAPVVQVPAAQQLLEDTTLSFSIANGNQLVVADLDANTLELRLQVNVGTLTLAPVGAAGVTVLEGSSGVTNLLRISGNAAAINAALDGLVYIPLADRSGSDELTLQLSDRGQSGAGGNQVTYARVPIAITAVPGQPAPAGRAAALVGINTAPQLTGTQAVLPNISEDQISTFTSSQLLQGFSDPDQGDQLRVENVRVSSGNGRLAVDANGQWTLTPEANANGLVTLAYDVVDGHGGRVAATNGFTINAVNDAPRRLDDGPKALYVIEDAAITPLGLGNLAWSTGAERDPLTDQLRQIPVADEAAQTLTFTITALPAAGLGQIGWLDANANNAFVAVTAGQQLSLAQLQGLQFRAAADAYGAGTFTFAVSDGAAAQGGLTTTETFTINVLAVNDPPVRTSPALAPRVISNAELVVDRTTNLYQTVTVGLANLLFNTGGDALEQASQQLLYRIARLPNANVGQVTLADGSVVLNGNTYTLPQLRDLVFRPARGVEKLSAAERLGELRLQVTDTPNAGGDPARTTELKVPILIDTNKASGRAGARIAGLTSDEQAIQAVLALDPTNPDTGFQNPVAGNGANQAMGQAKGLNTSLYSQLESDNPLYLAAIGGNKLLDGQEVNYAPSAVPFLFDLPINAWAPTSWANGGLDPTHTLLYRSTLSGQLRSNDELTYTVAGTAPGGFTLSSSGAWSFDPLDAAYAGLTTEGATQQVTARYQAGTRTGEITIELRRTATTVIAEVIGNIGAMTTSRGDWIAANPEGRDRDRYFKYVSEYVLTSYGAIDSGERNDDGEKIFAWNGAIATADGQPLRQLDGTVITTAGYYDFTRRDGQGDGVEFVYETVSEKGKQVDYIVGIRFFLRNNVFGDNDPAADNIRDPGAPVTILRELGVITAVTLTQNETVRITAQSPLSVDTRVRGSGSMVGLAGTNDTLQGIAARASVLVSSGSAGDTSSGLIPQSTGAGDDDGTGTGSGEGESAGKGAGVGGLGAGADKIAKGRGRGDGGDSTADGLGKGAGERGLRLDPLRTMATAASATPESLLSSLSDTNILGANLLDALALGAGLLYLLYGPKAVDQGKRGLRGWLAGVAGGGRRGAVVPGEQLVLSLILTRQENGLLRLVAAQLTAGGVRLVAQQDLASAATDAEALQEPVSALLAGLQQQGQRYDLLLLDGQLDRAFSAADQSLAALAQQRLPLASAELAAAVAAASPAEYASLQQWLNKPSQTLPPDSAVAQALQRRCSVHEQTLPPDQAQMAAMLELSLALTWSQR